MDGLSESGGPYMVPYPPPATTGWLAATNWPFPRSVRKGIIIRQIRVARPEFEALTGPASNTVQLLCFVFPVDEPESVDVTLLPVDA